MIKINLAKNRVTESTGASDAGLAGGTIATTSSASENREAIVKILMMLLFTVGLMLYENQNINSLNTQAQVAMSQANQREQDVLAKAPELEGIKDIVKEAEELNDKLKVLKTLSRLRLREVKTLDFMQSNVPEKLWLKSISFESEPTGMERGHYKFSGNAVGTEDLSDFVKRLEDSAYLTELIVIKNVEIAGPGKTGNLRDFNFTAEVESKN